jgi:hypothetical protein
MRVAILIGVSEYLDKRSNLPACKYDVEHMAEIIKATGKYDEVLFFSGDVRAAKLKTEISQSIDSLSKNPVEEVFFYYTGHGDFRNNEFYFALTDYSETSLRQTSLQNSEMDNWLRALNPKLAVKIVDACNSGTLYIKDDSYFEAHIKKSVDQFEACYFMFSSSSQEPSYQDNALSYFTRSF